MPSKFSLSIILLIVLFSFNHCDQKSKVATEETIENYDGFSFEALIQKAESLSDSAQFEEGAKVYEFLLSKTLKEAETKKDSISRANYLTTINEYGWKNLEQTFKYAYSDSLIDIAIDKHKEWFEEATPALAYSYSIKATLISTTASAYDSALVLLEQADTINRKYYGLSHPQTLITLGRMGLVHKQRGDLNRSLDTLRNVLQQQLKLYPKPHKDLGFTYEYLTRTFLNLNKYDSAKVYARKGMTVRGKTLHRYHPSISHPHNNIGNAFNDLRQTDSAIYHYEKANEIIRNSVGENNLPTAFNYGNMGNAFFYQQKRKKALEMYEKARYITRKANNKPQKSIVNNYMNTSNVYKSLLQYQKAIESLDYALAELQQLDPKDPEQHFKAYRSQYGDIYEKYFSPYLNLGDTVQAQRYVNKAIEFKKKYYEPEHPELIPPYQEMVEFYRKTGDFQKAFEYLGYIQPIIAKHYPGVNYKKSSLSWERGLTYYANNQFEEAINQYQQSSAIVTQFYGADAIDNRYEKEKIAEAYIGLKDYDPAISYLKEAEALVYQFNKKRGEEVLITPFVDIYNKLSACYYWKYYQKPDLALLKQADHYFQLAYHYVEKHSSRLDRTADKSRLLRFMESLNQQGIQINEALFEATQQDSFLENTFNLMERNKSNLLKAHLQQLNARAEADIPTDLLEREKTITEQIIELEASINKATNETQKSNLVKEQFQLIQSKDSLEQYFQETYPIYQASRKTIEIPTIKEIQEKLEDDELFLEFFMTDTTLRGVGISNQHISYLIPDSSTQAFSKMVVAFHDSISVLDKRGNLLSGESLRKKTTAFHQIAHDFYKMLLKPFFDKHGEKSKLIIIPGGATSNLVFELFLKQPLEDANFRKTDYVLKDHTIVYEYSSALLYKDLFQNRSAKKAFAGFAPKFEEAKTKDRIALKDSSLNTLFLASFRDDDFGLLKYNIAEVNSISSKVSGNSFTSNQSQEGIFKKEALNYRILHLATHAAVNVTEPDSSFLHLGLSENTGEEDNILFASELSRLNLNAELAVLSACETNLGEYRMGEGVMSLARSFKYAGCPNVVTSLWKAEDESTKTIMVDFYEELKAGKGKAEALQSAKLNFLGTTDQRFTHPFYWGAFVLIGDDKPIDLPTSGNRWIWGLLSVLAIGIMLWFGRKLIA